MIFHMIELYPFRRHEVLTIFNGREGLTVNIAGAIFFERLYVSLRPIPLVLIKSILRIFFVHLPHNSITGNFRDDRSGGTGKNLLVRLNNRYLIDRLLFVIPM